METPAMRTAPSYDVTTVVYDPTSGTFSNKIKVDICLYLTK